MISAFTGKTGSGKTYLMIEYAFQFWKEGRNIYSNTVLYFDNYKYNWWDKLKHYFTKKWPERGKIIYFEDINEIIDIKDGVIIFDEAQVLFNARLWESLPDEFQYKLQQHRKHNLDLLCTTQNMGTIDITYRRLVHEWIHCKNVFQLGSSPRILFGLFRREFKDVDQLYNSVDDLVVDTIKNSFLFIYFFSKTLYDTMYDIGFKKLRVICLQDMKTKKAKSYIIQKKKSLNDVLRLQSTMKRALGQKTK